MANFVSASNGSFTDRCTIGRRADAFFRLNFRGMEVHFIRLGRFSCATIEGLDVWAAQYYADEIDHEGAGWADRVETMERLLATVLPSHPHRRALEAAAERELRTMAGDLVNDHAWAAHFLADRESIRRQRAHAETGEGLSF